MFKYDNFNPKRIIEAVKLFIKGFWFNGRYYPPIAGGAEGDPPAPATDWKTNLSPEIKEDPSLTSFKTVDDLAKSYVGAQKFLGREKLPVPVDENDTETVNLILKRLGHPEKEDGYVLPTDFQVPPELPIDEALLGSFKTTAHKLGILPKQFAGLYKWYMTEAVGAFNKMGGDKKVSTQEAETALRKKWGAAYPQNIALAKKVFQGFADDKVFVKFDETYGNDPVLIEFFANLGKVLSEDQLEGKPSGLVMIPDEAQSEINKIKGDMNHPYWKAEHPQHQEAVERMMQFQKLVTAGE